MPDSILDDKFCYYCGKEYFTPKGLQRHILKTHLNTYAYYALLEALKERTNE